MKYSKFYFFTPLFLISILLAACTKGVELQKISGAAQGTTFHISFWQQQAIDTSAIQKQVDSEFARLDKLLSNYRPDSAIEQLNATQSTDMLPVDAEIISLIEQARIVSVASDGCYDLTIKPLFDLWGFKADHLNIPAPAVLAATLEQVGFKQIEVIDATHLRKLREDVRIDLSSIAQGYSVARITALLEQQGINNYLVEIGGELQTRGQKPDGSAWRVALEKPLPDQRTMHKVITITRQEPFAIMTSGTYRHFFDEGGKRYSHILNPKSGTPVTHNTVSVTVFHNNPTEADAWSTALLCLGRSAGIEAANKAGIAALFIEQQGADFKEFTSTPFTRLQQVEIGQ